MGRWDKLHQNLSSKYRSLSIWSGNRAGVPKGVCGDAPKASKQGVLPKGKVYSLPKGAQNMFSSNACCSVVVKSQEQGESACTVLLAGVLTSNPRGDRLKRLDGHAQRE